MRTDSSNNDDKKTQKENKKKDWIFTCWSSCDKQFWDGHKAKLPKKKGAACLSWFPCFLLNYELNILESRINQSTKLLPFPFLAFSFFGCVDCAEKIGPSQWRLLFRSGLCPGPFIDYLVFYVICFFPNWYIEKLLFFKYSRYCNV